MSANAGVASNKLSDLRGGEISPSEFEKAFWSEVGEARKEVHKLDSSFHEAGHYVTADHFGVARSCYVVERINPTSDEKMFAGAAVYTLTARFREAAIGWAGVIGSEAADVGLAQWHERTSHLWECIVIGGGGLVSVSDAKAIDLHRHKARTFKAAVKILSRNFEKLKFVAGQLMEHGYYKNSAFENDPINTDPCDPVKAPFMDQLAHMMPTRTAPQRVKLYHRFLLSRIQLIRAKSVKASNFGLEERIACENIKVAIRDGLYAAEFKDFPGWHKAYIADATASKKLCRES